MDILQKVSSSKNVGIIGAGPSGLCAAYRSLQCGHKITVFEQGPAVGGTWVYTPEVNVHTSMYENLLSNGPKEIKGFEGFPFPDFDQSGRSFVSSEFVLRYLENFSQPIMPYILLNHKVTTVKRVENLWHLQVLKTDKNKNQSVIDYKFDVLFVCNGHFCKPNLPSYYEKYQKNWIHSHDYRHPRDFNSKTVAIVGASFSGMDILPQIAKVTKKIYLCHNNVGKFASILPQNVQEKPRPVDAISEAIILSDGSILTDIDTIIYCTGYIYDFPFFESSNPIVKVLHNGKMVTPLFEHVAHIDFMESLFFIGLTIASTFPMCEYQVRFALALVAGNANGFSKDDVEEFEWWRLEELKETGLPPKYFHVIGQKQFEYYKKLCTYANIPYFTTPVFEKIVAHQSKSRSLDYLSYKKIRYRIIDDENFLVEE